MKGTTLNGALLVAGTAIGGGMLALPVLTSDGGFFPAIMLYFLCWIFMAGTGILLMEVVLWREEEINIVSMAKMTLGRWGKAAAWVLYLFFFYSLTVAYIVGGGNTISEVLGGPHLEKWSSFIFVLIFAPLVMIGAHVVSRVNFVLMAGLIISFLFFVVLGAENFSTSGLKRIHWPSAFLALPVIFASFGFQGIVPTLTNYLNRDPKKTRQAIWLGTFISFSIYVVWEALILGVVPQEGLSEAKTLGRTAIYPLKDILSYPWLFRVGEFFAFFAIVTSFLGVALGLFDFLADGLHIEKTVSGKFLLALLVFGPTLAFAKLNPTIFLNALHYAGGFGSALLLGLLPILMAWSGRYRIGYFSESPLKGGRPLLTIMICFVLLELVMMAIKFVK